MGIFYPRKIPQASYFILLFPDMKGKSSVSYCDR